MLLDYFLYLWIKAFSRAGFLVVSHLVSPVVPDLTRPLPLEILLAIKGDAKMPPASVASSRCGSTGSGGRTFSLGQKLTLWMVAEWVKAGAWIIPALMYGIADNFQPGMSG
jgi:hypothetical protein